MTKPLYIALAALIGVVAGVLVAPKSGKETRDELKKKAHDAKRSAEGKADHIKDIAKENVDRFKQAAHGTSEKIEHAVSSSQNPPAGTIEPQHGPQVTVDRSP